MSAGDHGPLRSARVGPNSATIGVPTAPAMCSGPVSPDTMRLAPFAIARMSVMRRRRRLFRGAARRSDNSRCRRFLARPPQHHRSQSAPLTNRRRERTEALRWPPFVRPRRAGIDQHVAARPDPRRDGVRGIRPWNGDRKRNRRIVHADGAHQPNAFLNHVRGVARIDRLRIEESRHRLAQVPPRKPDRSARADRSRQYGRLQQALQIDHRVVLVTAPVWPWRRSAPREGGATRSEPNAHPADQTGRRIRPPSPA